MSVTYILIVDTYETSHEAEYSSFDEATQAFNEARTQGVVAASVYTYNDAGDCLGRLLYFKQTV